MIGRMAVFEAVVHSAVAADQLDQFFFLTVAHRAPVFVNLLLLCQLSIGALLFDVLVHVDIWLIAELKRDRLRTDRTDGHLMIAFLCFRAAVPAIAVMIFAENQRAGVALDR